MTEEEQRLHDEVAMRVLQGAVSNPAAYTFVTAAIERKETTMDEVVAGRCWWALRYADMFVEMRRQRPPREEPVLVPITLEEALKR